MHLPALWVPFLLPLPSIQHHLSYLPFHPESLFIGFQYLLPSQALLHLACFLLNSPLRGWVPQFESIPLWSLALLSHLLSWFLPLLLSPLLFRLFLSIFPFWVYPDQSSWHLCYLGVTSWLSFHLHLDPYTFPSSFWFSCSSHEASL